MMHVKRIGSRFICLISEFIKIFLTFCHIFGLVFDHSSEFHSEVVSNYLSVHISASSGAWGDFSDY